MKIFASKESIVTLENVRRIDKQTSGTGAKSNPIDARIRILYADGESEFLHYDTDAETRDADYLKMAQILRD